MRYDLFAAFAVRMGGISKAMEKPICLPVLLCLPEKEKKHTTRLQIWHVFGYKSVGWKV